MFPGRNKIGLITSGIEHPVMWNIIPNYNISTIDIRIEDEFGDELYVPQYNTNSSGFYWQIAFRTEG